ncbi:MAG: VanZ family protein [Burkholderiales bacterium]
MSEPTNSLVAPDRRRSRLVRYLTLTYSGVVVYASLYPFSDWRAPVEDPVAFVLAQWPHYVTLSDIALNTLAYFPIGFLLALLFMERMPRPVAILPAVVCGAIFSLLIELTQAFLPSRVPSNLDLLTNASGALLGAMAACWQGAWWNSSGRLYRLRNRFFHQGFLADLGFALLACWLFTQLNAEIWLFGNGELLNWLPGQIGLSYSAKTYPYFEAAVAVLNFSGVAFLVSVLACSATVAGTTLVALTVLALTLKSIASSALFVSGNPLLWITPGSIAGLAIGVVVWRLSPRNSVGGLARASAACLALGTVVVNIAPVNPYLLDTLRVWRHGHYASFDGITHAISAAWPFLALAYLIVLMRRRAGTSPFIEQNA